MRHANVENEIEVAESAVPFHAASGWEVVEADDSELSDETADDDADGGKSDGEKPKSGRRPSAASQKKE
jgi:hypothetical protein